MANTNLNAVHRNHFLNSGFSHRHIPVIEGNGVRSVDEAQAFELGIRYGSYPLSGIWFPYSIDYGQVRVDGLPHIRYLSPRGSKSQAWKSNSPIITEGWKDAAAGSLLGGIETGAIPGISHYRVLPKNTGQVIIFDSDGWTNPDIFSQLIKAGIWANGRIQLVPRIEDNDKAGLLDWLQSLGQNQPQSYRRLISQSQKPSTFLGNLPIKGLWNTISKENKEKCIIQAIKLAQSFPPGEREALIQNATIIDKEFVGQALIDLERQNNSSLSGGRIKQIPASCLDSYIPIEICLSRDNQDLIRGSEDINNPRLFRLATDLVGVASALKAISQRFQGNPETIFLDCAKKSRLLNSDIRSIWRSANSKQRLPSVPINKIQDRVSYWVYQNK